MPSGPYTLIPHLIRTDGATDRLSWSWAHTPPGMGSRLRGNDGCAKVSRRGNDGGGESGYVGCVDILDSCHSERSEAE